MISSPRAGQVVQVWYNPVTARHAPHHGRLGTVVIPSRGMPKGHECEVARLHAIPPVHRVKMPVPRRFLPPRNHGVEVDGELVVFLAGNLRPPPAQPARPEPERECLTQANIMDIIGPKNVQSPINPVVPAVRRGQGERAEGC